MLTQLQEGAARVPQWAWVAASLVIVLIMFAVKALRARRAARAPKVVLDEGGKKGVRLIRSHRRELSDEARAKRRKSWRAAAGFLGMTLVVGFGFGLSANTSIVFADVRLHLDSPWTLTVGLALEGIVLGLTVWSWAFKDPGAARVAYMLVFAQAIGAIEVVRFQGEDLGTAAVRIVGPIMLAYGLHKMLKLEAKIGKIEITSDGMLARFWRDRVKRIESRLGIGSRGADAESISRRNAQDKLIELSMFGRPWCLVGKVGKRIYEKRLMKAGEAAFHGLDAFDELALEERLTTRIDRAGAFRKLPNRNEPYELRSLRPAHRPQGAPQDPRGFDTPLTSEGAAGRTAGPTEGAAEAHPGEAQSQAGPEGGEQAATSGGPVSEAELISRAFDVYCELRDGLPKGSKPPSQNAFEALWRERKYGLSTDNIRILYKQINDKMGGQKA